jgi:hypothetical protein
MCHFVTLVAPTDDVAAVRTIMSRHDRNASLVEGRSLAAVLRPNERQYLTCRTHCDCGTVLARCEPPGEVDEAREAARLVRKGWSSSRIARALADRRKAATSSHRGPDSLQFWARVMQDLRSSLGLSHVGLFVHDYRGQITDELFQALRIDAPTDVSPTDALATMGEDRLMVFHA